MEQCIIASWMSLINSRNNYGSRAEPFLTPWVIKKFLVLHSLIFVYWHLSERKYLNHLFVISHISWQFNLSSRIVLFIVSNYFSRSMKTQWFTKNHLSYFTESHFRLGNGESVYELVFLLVCWHLTLVKLVDNSCILGDILI